MIWSRKVLLGLGIEGIYRRNGHVVRGEGGEVKYFLFRLR